jgi:hypothetical protein
VAVVHPVMDDELYTVFERGKIDESLAVAGNIGAKPTEGNYRRISTPTLSRASVF